MVREHAFRWKQFSVLIGYGIMQEMKDNKNSKLQISLQVENNLVQ